MHVLTTFRGYRDCSNRRLERSQLQLAGHGQVVYFPSAWAEVQIASLDQQYLDGVVKPQLARLLPLWLSSLREYARLKFEPEITTAGPSGALNAGLDQLYAAFNRETLHSVLSSLLAQIRQRHCQLIDEDSEFVFNALDEKATNGDATLINGDLNHDINYRDEPVAFFFRSVWHFFRGLGWPMQQ
ncbi:hypothetical protein MRB53_039617 [Persea americana]|nr:hypothetical protein MRB53_039617 [Persea americana]